MRLHITFLMLLAWVAVTDYVTGGMAAALDSFAFIMLVFLCVTLHEFGHIAMGRRFGVKTPEVILSPIGGIANMERIPEKPSEELLVAIAGPLVNVAIVIVMMAIFGLDPRQAGTVDFTTAPLAQRLLVVNVMLVLFNLIPAFPMDGGRMLRAVLAMFMEARKATAVAARIGQVFAFIFVITGLVNANYILLLVGVFIYIAAASEEQSAAFRGFASRLKVRDAMEASPVTLSASAPLSQAIETLLASPQREFPVLDGSRLVGLLDRNAMLAGLRDLGAEAAIGNAMAEARPALPDEPLVDAFTRMRTSGAAAAVVVGPSGQVIGLLTQENVAEMMMIESARPGWRFQR